ncbi:MAG: acyl-CoA thioesterase [Hyphomicrobiales bacterium]|nr:acyl-CoA thioesterase [Hyphomicrobiales bacterium]
MFSRQQPLRIRWGDCDPAGIVFYPRYFEFFNECTELLFDAALSMKKRDWFARHALVGIPMVDLRSRFLRTCRYGDDVSVQSGFVKIGRSSFQIQHALTIDGAAAVEALETRVWTTAGTDGKPLRAVPIPDEVAACMRRAAAC